ncbi:uncharacterized protein M8220_000078 isoform 1-T1 [Acridotheres tristis]
MRFSQSNNKTITGTWSPWESTGIRNCNLLRNVAALLLVSGQLRHLWQGGNSILCKSLWLFPFEQSGEGNLLEMHPGHAVEKPPSHWWNPISPAHQLQNSFWNNMK